jgi:hypothetical protein
LLLFEDGDDAQPARNSQRERAFNAAYLSGHNAQCHGRLIIPRPSE